MGVRQASKHDLAVALQRRYWAAAKREQGRLLDEFVAVTGYHRKHALVLLRRGPPPARRGHGGRPVVYGADVVAALEVAAAAAGWICGKRLAPFLDELVPALEQEGALRLAPEVRAAVLAVSASTLDRRLAPARARAKPRGVGTTKPGALLEHQVPIRVYTPWDEQRPGVVEVDLVAHGGERSAGDFLYTLTLVDIATQWTACEPVANRGQRAVFGALEVARARLPCPLLGLDIDNGSEFLNAHLVRYCRQEQLTLTRCRPYHKNDQAHVEQKNGAVVRQLVGYDRYEGAAALAQLGRVYALVRVYVNGDQPVLKLIAKDRVGAKVHKRYDTARTPFRRALAAGVVTAEAQAAFAALLQEWGPLTLRRRLDTALDRLWALRVRGPGARAAIA